MYSDLQFAICLNCSDGGLLTPRRIYQILPDESAARSGHVRVIDNEGEDYLYPASQFVMTNFAPEIAQQ